MTEIVDLLVSAGPVMVPVFAALVLFLFWQLNRQDKEHDLEMSRLIEDRDYWRDKTLSLTGLAEETVKVAVELIGEETT